MKKYANWTKELIFIHHRQDWRPPYDVTNTCIMNGNWRLINGKELYDISKDPLQEKNLATEYPKIIEQLLADNANFIESAKANSTYSELPIHIVGNSHQKEIKLTIQHAIGEDKGIWKPEQVAAGMKNTNNTHALKIERKGKYRISCRRWPKECSGLIWGVPDENPKGLYDYQIIRPQKVRIQIANQLLEKAISSEDEAIVFDLELEVGKTFLLNDFIESKEQYGVYYTYIKFMGDL